MAYDRDYDKDYDEDWQKYTRYAQLLRSRPLLLVQLACSALFLGGPWLASTDEPRGGGLVLE